MDIDYFLIYFGLVPLAAGLYFITRDWVHTKYGYPTEGKVVEVIRKWSTSRGKTSYYYYPIIEFTTAENETKKLLMEISSTFQLYAQGEKLEIVYYKNNIYPTAAGWKVFYVMLTMSGVGIILYQFL